MPLAQMNVRFEGNNGHYADVTRCLLMTRTGPFQYSIEFVGRERLDAVPGDVGTTYGNLLSLRCLATDGFNPGYSRPGPPDGSLRMSSLRIWLALLVEHARNHEG